MYIGEWDFIVVDMLLLCLVLDFLDASNWLGCFFDGWMIRLFIVFVCVGGKVYMKVVMVLVGMVVCVFTCVIGGELFSDLLVFVFVFEMMFGGFRECV